MGGFISGIVKFVGSVVGAVVNAISSIVGALWNIAFKYIIEPIMNFLGFVDEDIYNISIISSKVYEDEFYEDTRTKLILDKVSNNLDAKKYILNYSEVGEKQFSKFYYKGKYDYLDYLPESTLQATSVPTYKIKDVLEKKLNTKISIVDIIGMVPTDEDWCKYQMQEQYDYNVGKNYLLYNNKWYQYIKNIYDINNNVFKVYFNTIEELKKITYSIVETEITSLTDTTDNKHITTKEEYHYYSNNIYLYTDTIIVSETDAEIAKDSEESTSNSTLISEETITNDVEEQIFTIDNHNNTRRYIVKYIVIDESREYYWIYDPTTNEYPEISSPLLETIEFEMYPVVMLRNNHFNVADYERTSIGSTPRPPSVTKERYEDTVELLNSIGVSLEDLTKAYEDNENIDKLQDAFFLMGICPSNTEPIISKALYEMFDFVYDTLPYTDTSKSYAAVFKENPFNAAISWVPRPVEIRDEVIGNIGTHTHTIRDNTITTTKSTVQTVTCLEKWHFICTKKLVETYKITKVTDSYGNTISTEITDSSSSVLLGDSEVFKDYEIGTTETITSTERDTVKDLIIKKQISKTQTKTLSLYSFTSFTIIRHGGGNGGVTLSLDDKNLIIPLAVDVANRLSLIERTQLLDKVVYLQFYAVQHIHLKWYQTSKFMSFVNILSIAVTVVVSVVSFGSMTAQTVTLTSALWSALKAVAIAGALYLAVKAIDMFVGDGTLKILLKVAATAIAMYVGGAFENFSFTDAVQLANSAVDAIDTYIKDITANLVGEINEFSNLYQEKLEVFEDITKQLNSGLSVEDIVDVTITSADTTSNVDKGIINPSVFYYMAINAYKDFDILYALPDNSVSDFVNNKLQLINSGE